jgi:hypothetical protein
MPQHFIIKQNVRSPLRHTVGNLALLIVSLALCPPLLMGVWLLIFVPEPTLFQTTVLPWFIQNIPGIGMLELKYQGTDLLAYQACISMMIILTPFSFLISTFYTIRQTRQIIRYFLKSGLNERDAQIVQADWANRYRTILILAGIWLLFAYATYNQFFLNPLQFLIEFPALNFALHAWTLLIINYTTAYFYYYSYTKAKDYE